MDTSVSFLLLVLKMKIYVTRHGQTVWNARDRVCGRSDIELTEKGRHQASIRAESLKDKRIDLIIASPLQRAQETAQIISNVIGAPIITDERIIEINFGTFEGVQRTKSEYEKFKKNFAFRYPNGESLLNVAARVYPFLDFIRDNYADKTVLIVCHRTVIRTINTYFNSLTDKSALDFAPLNCEILEYEY